MASGSDTLHISSLRLNKDYPIADLPPDPVNHPEAAAAARARIAAINTHPLPHPESVPAAPTADLILDKPTLARRLEQAPLVAAPPIPSALKPILTAVGVFLLILLVFKSPVIISQLKYALTTPPAAPSSSNTPALEAVPAASTITIPKINVQAPVQYIASNKEADIQKALEDGVVHYASTAVPGAPGNVAIFGHSSNDWWEPGNYKFVFVLLDKLSPGDQVTLDYHSKRYTYEVTGSRVVDPTEVSVLYPTKDPTLTIITCSPPGTSLRRLVVTARQTNPAASQVAATTPTTTPNPELSLPSSAPSFFQQVKDAWQGITKGFSSLFGGDTSSNSPTSTGTGQLPAIK